MVTEDEDLSGNNGFKSGYDISKWVSERIINIARAREISVSIYRLSNVAGHSTRGVMVPNNILVRFVQGCIQLGMAPDGDDIINVIPVDAASRMLVTLVLHPPTPDANFHLVNPVPTRVQNVVAWLIGEGYRIRPCPEAEWRDELRRVGGQNAFRPFLPLPFGRSLFSNRTYECERARKHLGEEFDCPPFDQSLFTAYLSYLLRAGHLPYNA